MSIAEITFIIVFFILPLLTCLAIYVLGKVLAYQEKKSKERNADFYEFREEVFKSQSELLESMWYIDEVKKDIDNIIAEMPYLTEHHRKQAEESLEIIRNDLVDYRETVHRPLKTNARLLRERLNAWEKLLVAQGEKIY